MKSTARIGIVLLMLNGCSAGDHRPDYRFGDSALGSSSPVPEMRAASRPALAKPAEPVYVMLTPADGGAGPAIAQAHVSLPAPGVVPQPATTAGNVSPQLGLPTVVKADYSDFSAPSDRPNRVLLKSTTKESNSPVVTPLHAETAGPGTSRRQKVESEPNGRGLETRPALSDVLGNGMHATSTRAAPPPPPPETPPATSPHA